VVFAVIIMCYTSLRSTTRMLVVGIVFTLLCRDIRDNDNILQENKGLLKT